MPPCLHASMPPCLHASMPPCLHASIITQTKRGFTLSELLISLAVLGLISALTLPTIVNNIELSRKKTLFKETFNTLQTVINDGMMTGELPNLPRDGAMFEINALKQWFNSKTDIIALDCHAINNSDPRCSYSNTYIFPITGPRFILKNGGLMAWAHYPHSFYIWLDYNHGGQGIGALNRNGGGEILMLQFQAVRGSYKECDGTTPPLGKIYPVIHSCSSPPTGEGGFDWLFRT